MQQKHLNSKVKEGGDLFNTSSKATAPKPMKHLDFQLKQHEANLIRSRLPAQFLLINLKTTELEKIKAQRQVKIPQANPPKNKHEAIQNKKKEKKLKAEERRGNNLVFKKQKNPENNDDSKQQQQQKSINNVPLSQKALGPEDHRDDQSKIDALHLNPFGYISEMHPRNNMQGIVYEMDKKLSQKDGELQYEHFGNYHDRNGYQEKFQENHYHFDGKMGEGVPYDYAMYQHEQNNWMGYFTFPFLPSGQPRYNPEFFEPRPEQTLEKNKLLNLFGLPFTQSAIQPVQKLCDTQKKFCLNFLNRLKSHKSSQIFRVAVNPEGQGIPDYYHIVYQPIDLTTIQKKVQKDKYSHIQEFHADINKIILNSYKYNFRETTYFITTVKFQDHYQALLKEAKENPEEFIQDPQQKIVKLKKVEDNEFYDQAQSRKKKKVEQLKNESLTLHKNLTKGKKQRNEAKSKNEKKIDENSQMLYNSMINESNDYSLPNESNLFNSISAENVKNKKSTTVHHRNMNIKKSQSIMMEEQNHKTQNQRYADYEQNFDEFNVHAKESTGLKFHNSSHQGKPNQNHERENVKKSESFFKQNFQEVRSQQKFGKEPERKQKQEEEEFGDLGNFIFKIEEAKHSESQNNKSAEANKKSMNHQDIQKSFVKKASSSEIPIKTEIFSEVKQTANRFRISDEQIKMIQGLDESIQFAQPNQQHNANSNQGQQLDSKQGLKDQSEQSNGKLFEYFSIRQVQANKGNKNIQKSDKLNPNLKSSKAQSPTFQQTTIQNTFQSYASPASPAILTDSITQQHPKVARKIKKKEIDEDYKIQSEEEYVDNVKGKKTIYKQQSSLNNEESYSQQYSIPKNRKKISKKEALSLNETKKIQPRPRKQQGNPQNEIQARIHAEMENFYKLPPIINVLEQAPAPNNLLPPVEEASLNDQHSALNSALPVPFHSCIFLDKEDKNPGEVEQGIVDIMDLIG